MSTVIRRSVRQVSNRFQDFWLGISTGGTAPAEAPDQVYYATVSYSCTHSVQRRLELTQDDVFVDVGCGKGRVVCLAAKHALKQIIGIEYSPALALIAERNVMQLRGRRSPVSILCQPAEVSDYSEATALYFFNPFEPPLLDRVLHRIKADRAGKATRMAFVMESEALREVFALHKWLTCYDRFEDEDRHVVAMYRTVLSD